MLLTRSPTRITWPWIWGFPLTLLHVNFRDARTSSTPTPKATGTAVEDTGIELTVCELGGRQHEATSHSSRAGPLRHRKCRRQQPPTSRQLCEPQHHCLRVGLCGLLRHVLCHRLYVGRRILRASSSSSTCTTTTARHARRSRRPWSSNTTSFRTTSSSGRPTSA